MSLKLWREIYFVSTFSAALFITHLCCLDFSRLYAQTSDESHAALSKRATEFFREEKYGEALPVSIRAVAAAEHEFGRQDERLAKQLGQLGAIYFFLKRQEDAIGVMNRVFDIIEPLVIRNEISIFSNTAEGFSHLTNTIHMNAGRGDLQLRFLKRWIAMSEKVLELDHPYFAPLISQLADIEAGLGHVDSAKQLKQRAIDIAKTCLQSNHHGFAPDDQPTGTPGLVSKGDLLQLIALTAITDADKEGELDNAVHLLEFVVEFRENFRGPKESNVNLAFPLLELFKLGQLYQKLRKIEQAKIVYQKIISRGDALLAEHPDNKSIRASLNGAHVMLNMLIPNPNECSENNFTDDNAALVDYCSWIGTKYTNEKKYEKAEEVFKRIIVIREKAYGSESPDLFVTLVSLGNLYSEMGRTSEAKALSDRAKAIKQASDRMERETDVSDLINRWGEFQHLRGKFQSHVWSMLQHSIDQIHEYGANHPFAQMALRNVSQHYLHQEDWRNLTTLLTLLQNGAVENLRFQEADHFDVSSAQKETANTTGFKFDAWGEHIFEQLIWANYELAQGNPGRRLELQQNSFVTAQLAHNSPAAKALAQMAARNATGSGETSALVRERQDSVTEWQKLDKIRVEWLSKASNERNPNAESENWTRLKAFDARITAIDQELATKFPAYATFVNPAPLSVDETQALLGENEVLILFLDTPKVEPMPEQIFIWVVTKTGTQWLRTGLERNVLLREVQALRCGLDEEEWATPTKQGRCAEQLHLSSVPDPSKPLPFHLGRAHTLYKALFGQVENLITGKRLLIVPSGPLTSLPFHVLVTKKPEKDLPDTFEAYRDVAWLARSHAVVTLPSVSSLKALRQHTRKSDTAADDYIGYGNPALKGDGGNCRLLKVSGKCPGKEPTRETAGTTPERATIRGGGGRRSANATSDAVFVKGTTAKNVVEKVLALCPLPDTAYEIRCVGEHFRTTARLIRLEHEATKADIKALNASGQLARYRIVHFATHGLLSGEVKVMAQRHAEPALVLSPPDTPTDAGDNGLLMASDVAGLKLNADWVVLSACNTAAGDHPGGEALSGLARAFFYAGGRTLLVSHWPVYSDAAVRLTTEAFAELNRDPKIGRAEAYQHAMRVLIDDHTQADNAHPAVWAPFVVVGEGGS